MQSLARLIVFTTALLATAAITHAQGPVLNPTARKKPAPLTVTIYPNPAAANAVVDLEPLPGTPQTVVVTDMRGERWIEIAVKEGQKTVELVTADLANGVYVVTVTTSTAKAESKLIVQH